MSLYCPYGSSENGIITLEADPEHIGIDTCECVAVKMGMMITQGEDTLVIDDNQMEQLYQILKHNR